jgi:hypothetical protein
MTTISFIACFPDTQTPSLRRAPLVASLQEAGRNQLRAVREPADERTDAPAAQGAATERAGRIARPSEVCAAFVRFRIMWSCKLRMSVIRQCVGVGDDGIMSAVKNLSAKCKLNIIFWWRNHGAEMARSRVSCKPITQLDETNWFVHRSRRVRPWLAGREAGNQVLFSMLKHGSIVEINNGCPAR